MPLQNSPKPETHDTCVRQGKKTGSPGTSVIRPMRKVKPRWWPLTSNSSEDRKQPSYHFPQLIPVDRISNLPNLSLTKLSDVSLTKLSVHKTIVLFFKSMSKYEISAHSLPRWRKLNELLGVSPSPFLLFLTARLTRSWLHFLDSSSRSRYTWTSLESTTSLLYTSFQAQSPKIGILKGKTCWKLTLFC